MDKIAHKHTNETRNSEYHGELSTEGFDLGREVSLQRGTHTSEFARGVGQGVIDEVKDCIHFLATPGCIKQVVVGTTEAVGTAANYYSDKIGHHRLGDISADGRTAWKSVQNWGNYFMSTSDFNRGEVVGRLATQVLPCMAAANEARLALRASRLTSPLAEIQATTTRTIHGELSKLDKAPVPTVEELSEIPSPRTVKWGGSEAFHGAVQKAVNELPDEIKQILHDNNISVHAVDRISDMTKAASPATRSLYRQHGQSIWIAERFMRNGELMAEIQTTDRILKHQIAHMLDDLNQTGLRLSDAKAICASYVQDLKSLTGIQKQVLNHYAGGNPLARRSVFAEAYAITHSIGSPADAMWRQYFAKAFPNTMRLVKDAELP